MRFLKQVLVLVILATLAACSGKQTDNNATLTINGRLWPKGATAYNYGTHLITVDRYTSYLVESTSLTLDSYNGDSVVVTLKDMGIRTNPGPELYNVITITPL